MTDLVDGLHATAPDDRYAAAAWLVARHAALRRLLGRVPCLLDEDGDPDVDLLAETIGEYEQYVVAWEVYEHRSPAPRDEARFEVWQQAGPRASALVACISCMSTSERARLRMLATFSSERVLISVADFASLDASGRALLADWAAAVCAA